MTTLDPDNQAQITLTRKIDAPLEDVFAAWTDPALLEQWQADFADVEPFEGGSYRFVTEGDDDHPGEHVVSGEYLEFVENRRLSQSWIYQGPDSPDDDLIFVLEVDFQALSPGQTSITITERGLSHADPESRIFSIEAWSATIEQLSELLE
ncbi:SRPBCC domain-containing protein [Devosia sp.]|uniref:SRPBCC family protein n=1 Tax=Devosia sp. TaxID=1871048 RepID=UPI0032676D17